MISMTYIKFSLGLRIIVCSSSKPVLGVCLQCREIQIRYYQVYLFLSFKG